MGYPFRIRGSAQRLSRGRPHEPVTLVRLPDMPVNVLVAREAHVQVRTVTTLGAPAHVVPVDGTAVAAFELQLAPHRQVTFGLGTFRC